MYKIGTQYIDNRDNTAWTIAETGVYNNETLYTVINRSGEYKRHYETKLKGIATSLSSIHYAKTASLIGGQGLEVIFKVDSQWYNKLKRSKKIQYLISTLDKSFLQSYNINEVISLDRPVYSDEKRASKGFKTIKLTYTTSYESMNTLKKLGVIDSTFSSTLKPYNPTITFNDNTKKADSPAKSQPETLKIGGIEIPVKNNAPHYETDSLVCVDFKSRSIVDFKYWMSYIKPV
jgi:hypothetical protein